MALPEPDRIRRPRYGGRHRVVRRATKHEGLLRLDSRDHYYREQRFADVFVSLRRAPLSVADRVAAIPGVTAVENRIVADVLLDVPGATEVVTGYFVRLPDRQQSML